MTPAHPYEALLQRVLNEGEIRTDRTGTGTYGLFAQTLRYDLAEGFPLITTKRVYMRAVVGELLWFLSGSTDVRELRDKYATTIWDEWERPDGTIGPGYGKQWRNFGGVDQIADVIGSITTDPTSRRHIVSAWNPPEIADMALPPCHVLFQFYVSKGRLSCHLYQRSADMFLGVPFNLASYALLTHMVAQQTHLDVGELVWTGGDVHVYSNHLEQARLQLTRRPRPLPRLVLHPAASINDYTPEHIEVDRYTPHPSIPAPVAI